ncbi:MAG: hypothetical protein ACON4M_06785, partial [Crocinitomicaceae bacterium]
MNTLKKLINSGLLSVVASLFVLQANASQVPCPNAKCEEAIQTINRDITPEIITPYVSNPVEDPENIPNSFTQVTNQLKPGSEFFSFISDQPTAEERSRVEQTEKMARNRGFNVHRIVIPIHALKLNIPGQLIGKAKSYFGTQKIDLEKTPEDIAKQPTPKERAAAKLIPIKNLIIKPMAWSAHTGPVGTIAVTAVSVIYSYFTSTYWHMFRVFFNKPHLIGEGTKLGKILENINLATLAEKFGLEIKNAELKERLLGLNGKKIAGLIQYATKKFAYN